MKRRGAGTLGVGDVGSRVLVKAWVHRRRDHGGVIFLDLRDRTGIVQAVVRPDVHPGVAEILDPTRLEWVVEVEGEVVRRSAETVNPKMPTGELEVLVSRAEVLARSEPLPFNVDGRGESSEETRLRYRFLDLRTAELQRNLRLRSQVIIEALDYFREREFVYIETPMLTRSTPEGARDYLVPSRLQHGSFYALPQSPQLFKQILMVSGFERYVQLARCFRDEDLRADRQPEFTQIDVELAFTDEEEIFEVSEGLFARLFPIVGVEVPRPFRRLAHAEAMLRYGTDRPDLRVDLEIVDVTERLRGSGFRAFQRATDAGGVIRALAVPGAAGASRKQIDRWGEIAQKRGAAGVLSLKRIDGETTFQVKDVLGREELDGVTRDLALEDGSLALIVAGPIETTAAALGELRVVLGREFGHLRENDWELLWVTHFPLLEWDGEMQSWGARHHPFTSPLPEDLGLLEEDPAAVRARAYDVVLNGHELGGGSIRIHRPDVQRRMFAALGIDASEAEERFGFLLEALRYGAPPHGGIAFGFDRVIMLMAGAPSLRDVMAFPKTASALCLMTGAPSTVDAEQLQEIGIRLAAPRLEPRER
jgi:aspartyl-tRNA synthetase